MEFMNNIWIALTTSNESLVSVLGLIFIPLESFITMLLSLTIIDLKVSNKKKLLHVLCMTIIGFITFAFCPMPLNTFVNYISTMFCMIFIFKINLIKSFFATIFSNIVFALIGTLITNPFLNLLNITSSELGTVPIYRLSYLATIYVLVLLIISIIKCSKFKISLFDDLDKKSKIIIYLNFIFGILALSIQAFITFYYIDILPIIITFLSFIILLAYFVLSIYSLTRIIKLNLTTKKLQSAEEYNSTLRILHDNVRAFKHDFDNIVTTIGGYIRTNDMDGLKQYYVQLEDDCQKVNNLYILNPEIVNNDGIYNLIMKKYHEAEEKDITVNISFLLDLGTLKMKIYEFARILGILLDNAIEASSECTEKIINLTFRNDSNNYRQLVIVENTYSNKDVDTEKIFEKGYSGKENHTGLGLWEVNKILSKSKNLTLYTNKNDKYFSQQLEIYYYN